MGFFAAKIRRLAEKIMGDFGGFWMSSFSAQGGRSFYSGYYSVQIRVIDDAIWGLDERIILVYNIPFGSIPLDH
ncbi:hypothetical protein RHMOL_Rhmol09G0090600 [Rhododendron molle]|uniref:Uncharacterized protein n=1 Tax=Rhododendron molle TaxID=49168 RepID=A0ACC0MB85_RHOML|nr:hypothetical protein RHMOL_Rhmol09G0090600 [Rhododendron molle]